MTLGRIISELQQYGVDEDVAAVSVVAERNRLLSECDWTQVADVELSDEQRQAWSVYRQELRDITKRADFPFLLSVPVPPPSKTWVAERTRSAEEEEQMRLEREELERKALQMQAEYERSLQLSNPETPVK